jgi:2-dehydro-3-deoxygalactonokinase
LTGAAELPDKTAMPPDSSLQSGALIVADWGTSRLRARLVSPDGAVLAEAESGDGINALSGGHEGAFQSLVAHWPNRPAILAGMVGSAQGWREAPQIEAPVTAGALASHVLRFTTRGGRTVVIVPGIKVRSAARDGDLMRGEETQIVGLLDREPQFSGIAILPGTHSKWVRVANGAIGDFQTFLTGEMFDLLARHSFLRHSVAEGGELADKQDFAIGVRRTGAEGLPFLAAIFSVRARQILNGVKREDNLAYLSGVVIGGEIAAATAAGWLADETELRIIGAHSLQRLYRHALDILGRRSAALDGDQLATAGLIHLARRVGLITEASR